MAISLRGNASNQSPNANANITVTLPGGTVQNDVVYAAYSWIEDINDLNPATVTAGYTELADLFGNDTECCNFGAYRKVQGSTPDTTVVFSGLGAAGWGICAAVEVLTGVDTTTPEDATTTTATGTNNPHPDCPSITTVTANAWVIAAGGCTSPSPASGVSAPTNYVNLIEAWEPTGWGRIMMSTRQITSPGAENPSAYNAITGGLNDSWCAATIAVRPAATAQTSLIFRPPPAAFIHQLVR